MLAPTLPDLSKLDREALQALLLSEHQERIATQEKLLRRETEIEHLKLLLSQLRRMQFGPKSEKLERQIEQLELRLEDYRETTGTFDRVVSIGCLEHIGHLNHRRFFEVVRARLGRLPGYDRHAQ